MYNYKNYSFWILGGYGVKTEFHFLFQASLELTVQLRLT